MSYSQSSVRKLPPRGSSPSTSSLSSSNTAPTRIIPPRSQTIAFVDPVQNPRPAPIILTFDSDDAYNNALRTPDGKAQYLVNTPKRSSNTFITGRREGAPQTQSFSVNSLDRPIATIVRNRWKSDKVAFGDGPANDIGKLFKTTRATDIMSEVDRVRFNDENDRWLEWRGAHVYRALQLWTIDEPQLLVAQFRFPEGSKPQLIIEPPREGWANLDMIVVTFLLLDKDRKRNSGSR